MQRNREHRIDKTPQYCAGPDELLAGDILIFNYNPNARHFDSGGFMTLYNQRFLNEMGGHHTSVHAGFIIDTPTGKKLAHVVGKGFKVEDLDNNFLKRTVHIYRPRKHREELAGELAKLVDEHFHDGHKEAEPVKNDELFETAGDLLEPLEVRREQINNFKKKVKKIKWDMTVAVRALIHRIFTSIMLTDTNLNGVGTPHEEKLPDNVISKNTMCSKFVADSFISASNRLTNVANHQGQNPKQVNYQSLFMNISPLTPPKALQAYLYRNINYDYLVMPHVRGELYNRLRGVVVEEIARLKKDIFSAGREKGARIERALEEFEKHDANPDLMQKSIALLKGLVPLLKHNTGGEFRVPTSYKRVMSFARKEGIYPEYINYELHDRREGKYRQLAREQYHFNAPMAELYRNARRKGYSDEEAKFECKPSFGKWFKLCPARNVFLTCTIIGFFAWILPHGLARTNAAIKRNKKQEDQYKLGHVRVV